MQENHQATKYFIKFMQLAACNQWGQAALLRQVRHFSHLDALLKGLAENAWSPLYTVQPGYINPPLQQLGCRISCAFGVHGTRQARYECAFIVCPPRNIMCLQSAWAEPGSQGIYPCPFIACGLRNTMCLPSTWAESACQSIYPPPFTVAWPRNIMHLQSAWA